MVKFSREVKLLPLKSNCNCSSSLPFPLSVSLFPFLSVPLCGRYVRFSPFCGCCCLYFFSTGGSATCNASDPNRERADSWPQAMPQRCASRGINDSFSQCIVVASLSCASASRGKCRCQQHTHTLARRGICSAYVCVCVCMCMLSMFMWGLPLPLLRLFFFCCCCLWHQVWLVDLVAWSQNLFLHLCCCCSLCFCCCCCCWHS